MTVVPSAEAVVTSTTETAVDGAMVEIPFVPAPLRQTVQAEVVDDTIVVVGQRQKKRKRSKKAEKTDFGGVETSFTPTEDIRAGPEEIVPFDFASAPNILDDELSEQEGGRTGKKRRSKKRSGGFFFRIIFSESDVVHVGITLERGEFAPAKERTEIRSGNVSHTFRS